MYVNGSNILLATHKSFVHCDTLFPAKIVFADSMNMFTKCND